MFDRLLLRLGIRLGIRAKLLIAFLGLSLVPTALVAAVAVVRDTDAIRPASTDAVMIGIRCRSAVRAVPRRGQ